MIILNISTPLVFHLHKAGVRVLVALDLEDTTRDPPKRQRTDNDFHNTKVNPIASFCDLDMRIPF
jgi:hypothetical protein